ncbi:MAG: hypothetical protein Ct9H300mP28_09370 [Pseudomonadota bacterium]|nr:MAG: hypothetical protein Ct9H300mP28_09370 [Pseudomonadota bacterium]
MGEAESDYFMEELGIDGPELISLLIPDTGCLNR